MLTMSPPTNSSGSAAHLLSERSANSGICMWIGTSKTECCLQQSWTICIRLKSDLRRRRKQRRKIQANSFYKDDTSSDSEGGYESAFMMDNLVIHRSLHVTCQSATLTSQTTPTLLPTHHHR